MFNEMTHFPLSYCSVCFWSWRTNQREKAWQILYKTVTSVFFCSSLGPEEADFTLSCQCFSSFSFLPLKIHNFWKTWKCKAKLYFFFFLLFYFISCLLVYLQGDLDQRLHSWCIKVFTGGLKTEKQELQSIQTRKKKKNSRISQKPAKPLIGESWCVWLQTWQTATRGPSTWGQSHWSPPSNVIITCHRTFGWISGVLGVFSLSSISMELLLAVQTNCRGRRSLRSAVLHGLGQLWPDTGEMSDGRGNGGRSRREREERKDPSWGLWCRSEDYGWLWCLETEFKKRQKKGQNSIKPYE